MENKKNPMPEMTKKEERLWGPDNRIKGGKYTEEGKQDLIRRYNEHKK